MQTLIGQIDRILYEKEGFFIAVLKEGKKVRGTYYESDVAHLVGAAVTLEGEYEEHKKYGQTFVCERIRVNQNELFFFLNRVIKGFTKKLTADLIEAFGEEGLVDVLDNDIEKLLSFKGIKEKRLAKIQQSWKAFRSMRELGEFLTPFGVTPAMLTAIATAFKEVTGPVAAIRKNPYVLTRVSGIGFRRADEVALKMGIDPLASQRLASAMDYLLEEQCEREGNSCVEKGRLFELLDELLVIRGINSEYEAILHELIVEQKIVLMRSNRLSPDRLYHSEKLLHESFLKRSLQRGEPLCDDLDAFLSAHSLTLGEEQRRAAELINEGTKLLFLVGYAGTGKSTTAKTLLDLLNSRYNEKLMMTCALSGIAAQRIGERTGYESATIQSLLVKYEERDTFPFSVLLIDEASMINAPLFARVMAKVDKEAVVIIVGDDAQLPPIGAGNVLSDVLTLKMAPIVMLTRIYRQSEEQAIAVIANDIRNAKIPDYRSSYEDFDFVEVDIRNYHAKRGYLSISAMQDEREANSEGILSEILHKASGHMAQARYYLGEKEIGKYLNYFQVITPMRGGLLGTDNLNRVLQEFCNANPKKVVKRGEREFRLHDKVVHIKNENMPTFTMEAFKAGEQSSEKRVFNGMSGLLFRIDEEEETVCVFYPNEELVVQYDYSQLNSHLMLSYALTIHKVQGMEYEYIVMPMSFSHYIMHNTKLLYTAITRAKRGCSVIGESGAFESACRRIESTRRDTVLLELGGVRDS